jgi:ABC-type amino acid transport system permease subunit
VWDWSTFIHYLHSFYLIKGAGISLALSIGAMAIGLMLGTIAALMRRSRRRLLRGPASFYIWRSSRSRKVRTYPRSKHRTCSREWSKR